MNKNSKIFVAGHKGLVGSAIIRNLKDNNYHNIITHSKNELDLTNQNKVATFFQIEKPEYVFLAAAKVGGINANNLYPADFIMENLLIQCNIINSCYQYNIKKLLFLGSSCIYPKNCPQPIKEEYLLTGPLEPTNEAYALAKISGLKMCQYYNKQYQTNYISVMPTNLYGPNDNFDLKNSHVIPAMIKKFHEAKLNNKKYVEIWGSGNPLREFLYVDDMADCCVFLMENYHDSSFLNIGTGKDIRIVELATLVKKIVDFKGDIKFNHQMPDGSPQKLLDISKLNCLGWHYQTELKAGIEKTYTWYKKNYQKLQL